MSTAVAAKHQVQYLELASIRESPLNPRKTFDELKLQELADDVAVHGVMQPIQVRPVPEVAAMIKGGGGVYEVVFGARRFRAATMAKLEQIPAFVVELSDSEALEHMVVENSQREDLDPLEEADGYRALHADHGLTAEEIANKVGKSRAHVYARIQLTKLFPKARKRVEQLKLGAERALLIARIPDESRQLEAVERIGLVRSDYETRETTPMGVREATRYVKDHYMLTLAGAPFDTKDAELVKRAGPCTTCPFRTKNAPDLFIDIKADLCTKPTCFAEKKAAAWANERKEAKEEGLKVLTNDEAHSVFTRYGGDGRCKVEPGAPYVHPTDQCQDDPKGRTWRELMGKSAPKPSVVGKNEAGRILELIPRAEAVKALEERGFDFAGKAAARKPRESSAGYSNAAYQRQEEARQREEAARLQLVFRAVGKMCAKLEAGEPDKKVWRLIVDAIAFDGGVDEEIFKRRGWENEDDQGEIEPYVDKLSEGQMRALAVELVLCRELYSRYGGGAITLKKACEVFGVDLDKVKKELHEEKLAAQAEAREKDKAERKLKKFDQKREAKTLAESKPEGCAVAGCKRPLKAKGLCSPHYQAKRKHLLARA